MNRTDAREVLEAIATRDHGVPEDALDRLGDNETMALITAAAAVAAEMKFEAGGDVRLITQFAREMERRYNAEDEVVESSVVAAVIRAALGEPELLDDVSGDEIFAVGMIVVYEIIAERFLGPLDLRAYYDEVLELAEEFATA